MNKKKNEVTVKSKRKIDWSKMMARLEEIKKRTQSEKEKKKTG